MKVFGDLRNENLSTVSPFQANLLFLNHIKTSEIGRGMTRGNGLSPIKVTFSSQF